MRPATATRSLPLPAELAWTLVTDVRNHVRWIPWTRVDAPNRPVVGSRFSTATGPRRAALVDRMLVERADPPSTADDVAGLARYRKLGPVLLGDVEILVRPVGAERSEVTWTERVHLRGTPPWLSGPLVRPVLTGMLRSALRRAAAEVDRGR